MPESAQAIVEAMRRERATAILRTDDQECAAAAMDAAISGGFRMVEFTLTVPGVFELIAEFSKRDGITVGAGTVMTAEQAERAVAAGARFIVSPVTDEVVISRAIELGAAAMPGTQTPTEMWRAHRAGAHLCKLFPVTAGGPDHVRSVLGPMPFLKIVPTNGVDETNAAAYLAAGAHAIGFVATLFERDAVKAKDRGRIEQRARVLLGSVR